MAADAGAPVDWCAAETLAWAAVLEAGRSIRLSGLDVQRGTFMHRQAVWHNQSPTGPATWLPLQSLSTESARLEIHNSVLSEEAVLGYEYGHSVQSPGDMTVWEAQFGDFVNGAQVYLDQYISSGEEKWGVASALTVLLPHGYEGVGPEHSNGFLSRMLQLCGADNLRVACPSTSGQYAHLLIRQALEPVRKPLIVMTPKGTMMSEPTSHTAIGAMAAAAFQPVLDDDTVADRGAVTRVVLSSGKVAYDLLAARDAGVERGRTAIVRLEQLYPFPAVELVDVLARYPSVRSLVWTQEETRHQGAWAFIRDELEALCPPGASLSKVARAMTAAGATASV
ncbi:MAG: 2-oxoglutarate dehydrogenase E1 component, partial [Brevundimonas sp.]